LIFGGLLYLNTGINLKPFVNKQNLNTMKKLLVVLAIGAFAACNGSGSSASTDSTAAKDSAAKMDSSSKMSTDTSKMKMADTTKKATDTTKK
jgi:hypothetical protein